MKKCRISVLAAAVSAAGIVFAGCAGNTQETTEQTTETSDTLVSTTTLETSTTVTTAQTDPAQAQKAEFTRYLKDLYNGANDYARGYPQKISGVDEGFASATTYLKYAMADFDGDGKLEMIIVESNNYPVEAGKTAENIDKGYLTFRMFETNDGGGIVENEKINGLSSGIPFSEYEKNIKCYNNGIIAIDQTDAVNKAWGYNKQEVKAFLYFDDGSVVKKLDVPLINEYLNGDGADNSSSYVLMQIDDVSCNICLGGAQDNYTEMTELTKEEYDVLEKLLTSGEEVKVEFKDISKENLGI